MKNNNIFVLLGLLFWQWYCISMFVDITEVKIQRIDFSEVTTVLESSLEENNLRFWTLVTEFAG